MSGWSSCGECGAGRTNAAQREPVTSSATDSSPKSAERGVYSQPSSVRGEIDREPKSRRGCIEALCNVAPNRICRCNIDSRFRRYQYVNLDKSPATHLRDVVRIVEKFAFLHDTVHDGLNLVIELIRGHLEYVDH